MGTRSCAIHSLAAGAKQRAGSERVLSDQQIRVRMGRYLARMCGEQGTVLRLDFLASCVSVNKVVMLIGKWPGADVQW